MQATETLHTAKYRRSKFGSCPLRGGWALGAILMAIGALGAQPAPAAHDPSELLGNWRGTSTCSDRVAAPACHDEVVVYEFTAGSSPGTVRWSADKVVDGQRQPMGEFDLAYDAGENCWAAEFSSPSLRSRWCLVVDGTHMTGTGQLLPGKQTVRRIDARRAP